MKRLNQLEFSWPVRKARPAKAVRSDPKRASAEIAVHFSSKTDEWATPREFFSKLNEEFQFTLDPCATHENAKCARHFTKEEDGLSQDWAQHTVFMNPPYGREISRWMRKAFESARSGATVVCLVPSRTDTKWWHNYAARGDVRFLEGRLKFGGSAASAPFPSAVVIFRPWQDRGV